MLEYDLCKGHLFHQTRQKKRHVSEQEGFPSLSALTADDTLAAGLLNKTSHAHSFGILQLLKQHFCRIISTWDKLAVLCEWWKQSFFFFFVCVLTLIRCFCVAAVLRCLSAPVVSVIADFVRLARQSQGPRSANRICVRTDERVWGKKWKCGDLWCI